MFKTISIKYRYTDNIDTAKKLLEEVPNIAGYDFEAASRFTKEQVEEFKLALENETNFYERIKLQQKIEANGLSHPSLATITHLSVGWSEEDAIVIICNNEEIRQFVCDYLVTTDTKQLWHNGANFDFKHIFYYTKQLPKNYVDTQLLAKTILNNADSAKSLVGLKNLMGWKYGAWALKKEDSFTLENMYEEEMLEYAATDACAVYCLYQDIKKDIDAHNDGWKI